MPGGEDIILRQEEVLEVVVLSQLVRLGVAQGGGTLYMTGWHLPRELIAHS